MSNFKLIGTTGNNLPSWINIDNQHEISANANGTYTLWLNDGTEDNVDTKIICTTFEEAVSKSEEAEELQAAQFITGKLEGATIATKEGKRVFSSKQELQDYIYQKVTDTVSDLYISIHEELGTIDGHEFINQQIRREELENDLAVCITEQVNQNLPTPLEETDKFMLIVDHSEPTTLEEFITVNNPPNDVLNHNLTQEDINAVKNMKVGQSLYFGMAEVEVRRIS